jgi:hypothetical protein
MTSQSGQEVSYQRLLRALGGYLDHEPAGRFKVIEVIDGFTLIIERGTGKPQIQQVHFERNTLAEQAEQLVRGRRVFTRASNHSWPLCRTGHQDFLRALGYELDDSEAREVAMDEFETGLLVTYSYLDPTQGYSWRKHRVTLSGNDMEEIINTARNRKSKGFLHALRR